METSSRDLKLKYAALPMCFLFLAEIHPILTNIECDIAEEGNSYRLKISWELALQSKELLVLSKHHAVSNVEIKAISWNDDGERKSPISVELCPARVNEGELVICKCNAKDCSFSPIPTHWTVTMKTETIWIPTDTITLKATRQMRFICQAQNESLEFKPHILYRPTVTDFYVNNMSRSFIYLNEGDNIRLTCQSEYHPNLTQSLLKDNEILVNVNDSETVHWAILNITTNDTGFYRCLATGHNRTSEKMIQTVVIPNNLKLNLKRTDNISGRD
ncbi:hypothetical protein Btru_071755 [Bulinus truncatus]|nr:hypothetical protein Btru_071755 [Bulinus truncatus]